MDSGANKQIYTKLNKYWFRLSEVAGEDKQTQRQIEITAIS
jgi:hypothetical protein